MTISKSGRVWTHLLCVGLGICLAISLKSGLLESGTTGERQKGESEVSPGKSQVVNPSRPGRSGNVAEAKAEVKTSGGRDDFAGAWKGIASRDLTVSQRLEMQIKILNQWAKVDLEAAMHAALDNAWDGGTEKGGVGPLMVAFGDAFREDPLKAWDLMQSGKLGLGAALFERQWIESAAEKEPAFLFSVAQKISSASRKHAIEQAMRSAAKSPEMKDAMIRKLIEMPDFPAADNYIAIAFNALPANEGNAAEVRGRLAAATNERAKSVLLHEYTSTLRDASAAVIARAWSQLDPEMQKRAAVAFFNGQQGTRNAPAVLDMLIKNEQWDVLRGSAAKLSEYGKSTTDPRGLAEWAMSLPQRGETASMFFRAMEPFVVRNNAEAKEWISSLPSGDWKTELALRTYANNALYARNDEELFAWTVERMANEGQREGMKRQYDDWLKNRGER